MLNSIVAFVIDVLHQIKNLVEKVSLQTGVFPDAWSMGYITPIPKEGDPLYAGNWRPISILPLPSKL